MLRPTSDRESHHSYMSKKISTVTHRSLSLNQTPFRPHRNPVSVISFPPLPIRRFRIIILPLTLTPPLAVLAAAPSTNQETAQGPKTGQYSIADNGPAASTKKRVPMATGAFSGPALVTVRAMGRAGAGAGPGVAAGAVEVVVIVVIVVVGRVVARVAVVTVALSPAC